MTIHGLHYRPLEYTPVGTAGRMAPVVMLEFRALFRSRWGVALFALCMLPNLVSLVLLAMQMGILEFGPARVRDMAFRLSPGWMNSYSADFYLWPGLRGAKSMLTFLAITGMVTSRSIARDRQAGALEMHWTRGITPGQYFAARWFGSFMLVSLGIVLAPTLLWLIGLLTAPDTGFFESTISVFPWVLCSLFLFTAVLTLLASALSAIPAHPNGAMILWVLLLAGTATGGFILEQILPGSNGTEAISPWRCAERLADAIAGVPSTLPFGPGLAALVLAGYLGVLGVLAARRLRLREAVL